MKNKKQKKVLVTGAGGFIGSHLVKFLKKKNFWVRGVDIKRPKFSKTEADQFYLLDLRDYKKCLKATKNIDYVYNLAANMGGIGFIETHKAEIVRDNILINTNMLEASRVNKIKKFFFSSSACVYPSYRQSKTRIEPLKESDAYPADPEDGYGWEKLFVERMCRHYMEDYGLKTYIARFHNVYGPEGEYQGGREKSPAAICRKVAMTRDGGKIEIWGDGKQTRSYCYIDDCIKGIYKLVRSRYHQPLNIGSDRLVTINKLVKIAAKAAGKKITTKHDLRKPQGVRGRNSDNTLIRKILKWEPSISLEEGIEKTYQWIEQQVSLKK